MMGTVVVVAAMATVVAAAVAAMMIAVVEAVVPVDFVSVVSAGVTAILCNGF